VLHRRVNPLQAQFFTGIASIREPRVMTEKFLFCSQDWPNLLGMAKEAVMTDRIDGQSVLVLAIGWVAALWLTLT
jgi:hypothetical protein